MAGGLDHLVIVGNDLDGLSDFYARAGFQVGAENRHNWGTLNRIVQFDGTFLELLTTEDGFEKPASGEAVASFTGPITDYLERHGEGLAMMVLEGHDAARDHAAFGKAGIGVDETFYFARQGRRPDGAAVEVAFSLAFARSEGVRDAGFFVCQQHAPEMFWNPAFQVHANGVTGVRRIVFVSDDPGQHTAFFEGYTGKTAAAVDGGLRFGLERGAVEVVTHEAAAADFGIDALPAGLDSPRFAAIEFAVDMIDRAVAKLIEGDITFEKRQTRVVVPARAAMGVTLAFAAG